MLGGTRKQQEANMAKKDDDRVYRLGMADPRTAPERVAALVNRAFSSKKKQTRKYDDDPTTMAINRRAKK
jgi:hypothetical protein